MHSFGQIGEDLVVRDSDTETGLYYYRARYYDPGIGRFLREDPIAFSAGVNFYRYVGNRPTNSVDPFGLNPIPLTWPWWWSQLPGYLDAAGNAIVTVIGAAGRAVAIPVAVGLQLTILAPATTRDEDIKDPKYCDRDKKKVHCWLSGEFKDPSVDPKFKMCSYSCSDGTARVFVIHIGLPCPPTPDRLPQ